MTRKAVVLSSGGIDSTTAMAIAGDRGYNIYSLSFRYGQRHSVELECAKKVALHLGAVEHKIVNIDLRQFGGSALTDDIAVPKHESVAQIDQTQIPVTYVPARNTIFLSYAMAWAEVLKAEAIFIGVTAVDYSGYPDCRPQFIEAFQTMANLATKTGVTKQTILTIETPLIQMSKSEIIRTGHGLGVDYSLTISCYDPDSQGRSCGRCDSCLHRKKGFTQVGIPDPTPYIRNVKNIWKVVKNRYRLSTKVQMNFELSFPKYLIAKCWFTTDNTDQVRTQKVSPSLKGIIFSDTIPLSWFTSSVLIPWGNVLKLAISNTAPSIEGSVNMPLSSNLNKKSLDFEYCTIRLNDPIEMTIDLPWSKEFTEYVQENNLFDI